LIGGGAQGTMVGLPAGSLCPLIAVPAGRTARRQGIGWQEQSDDGRADERLRAVC
jgi:hypothetical protein